MKIWVDPRPAPPGYDWVMNFTGLINKICREEYFGNTIESITFNNDERVQRMKIWIDANNPPQGDCCHEWAWCRKLDTAKEVIEVTEENNNIVEFINVGYGSGDYADINSDFTKLLRWFRETNRYYPVCVHAAAPAEATWK